MKSLDQQSEDNSGDSGNEISKASRWKSSLDLTEKAKKKRKKSILHQGLLDLINIGDPAVSSDNVNIKSLAANSTKPRTTVSLEHNYSKNKLTLQWFGHF